MGITRLPAFWLIVNCKNGVSSWELHRALGVTQKTAWFMLHRIRLGMRSPQYGDEKLGGEGGGPIEVDETFVGGKLINMHKAKKLRYERRGGAHGKAVVMGLLDRELHQVRAKVVPDVKRDTLQNEILREVEHVPRSIPMHGLPTSVSATITSMALWITPKPTSTARALTNIA